MKGKTEHIIQILPPRDFAGDQPGTASKLFRAHMPQVASLCLGSPLTLAAPEAGVQVGAHGSIHLNIQKLYDKLTAKCVLTLDLGKQRFIRTWTVRF